MKNTDSDFYFSRLRDAFKQNRVSMIGISLGSFQDDSICLEEKDNKWIVYSVDRGNRCKLREYESIQDACHDVIHRGASSDDEEEKTKACFDISVSLKAKPDRTASKKRRKVLKLAKGYWGAKSKQFRSGSEQIHNSMRYAYMGRKMRKRAFRNLWIVRINAAARLSGMSYSMFINGLKKQNIEANRKMLDDLAVNSPDTFAQLVHLVKDN